MTFMDMAGWSTLAVVVSTVAVVALRLARAALAKRREEPRERVVPKEDWAEFILWRDTYQHRTKDGEWLHQSVPAMLDRAWMEASHQRDRASSLRKEATRLRCLLEEFGIDPDHSIEDQAIIFKQG